MTNGLKRVAALAAAAMLSLAVVGCGGSSAPAAEPAAPAAQSEFVVPLTKVSGAEVHFSEANEQATVELTVAKGESVVVMAKFDKNDGEATAVISSNGEELTTDYFYDGYGCSAMPMEPGTYTVELNAPQTEGTMWALAYNADDIDYMNMDAEAIVNHILSEVQ